MRFHIAGVCALAAVALVVAACQPAKKPGADFGQRIVNADAEPHNWLSTGRNYQETRFSPLDAVNAGNVGTLGLAWAADLDTNRGQEATPIVVDGIVYTTSAWSKVQAFDGLTGKLLWQFDPKVPGEKAVKTCCDVINRGAAYWAGKLYVGAIDGRLIAVDAKTGQQVWSSDTVEGRMNTSITGAPRVVKGRVIIGNSGADMGARGYVTAYDAETGKVAWRFFLVPGPAGHKDNAVSDKVLEKVAGPTWSGPPVGGGGANPWDSFAYDPELDLLYVGAGNAGYWARKYRQPVPGANNDNLFVGSVVALRPETGEYVWHYQETPGDQWDYTSTQHMILTDLTIGGQVRKVLLHAPKNGFFYVLDRATGKVISAKPYGKVNWASHVDLATGRPVINPDADYTKTGKPWLGYPGSSGAHDWQPMSFSPKTGLVYIPTLEVGQPYAVDKNFKEKPKGFSVGIDIAGQQLPDDPKLFQAIKATMTGALVAWDPVNQKEVWRAVQPGHWNGGTLATAGGLVFAGDMEGAFKAYDATTGKQLWSFDAQTAIMAAPVTWAKDGVQYVTVVVGWGGAPAMGGGAMNLDWKNGGVPRINRSRVLTFALGAKGALPPPQPPAPRIAPNVEQFADAATVAKGRAVYHRTCFGCHGFEAYSGGLIPDLRYSGTLGDKETWTSIVADGALADRGMVSFSDNFTPDEIEAVRAYLIDRSLKSVKR